MEVTSASFSFYCRFGFQGYSVTTDERGHCFGGFSRLVTPADVAKCQQILVSAGAVLPPTYKIPINIFKS